MLSAITRSNWHCSFFKHSELIFYLVNSWTGHWKATREMFTSVTKAKVLETSTGPINSVCLRLMLLLPRCPGTVALLSLLLLLFHTNIHFYNTYTCRFAFANQRIPHTHTHCTYTLLQRETHVRMHTHKDTTLHTPNVHSRAHTHIHTGKHTQIHRSICTHDVHTQFHTLR